MLITDAVGSEVWEARWETGGGCRVPVHPGQGDHVQVRGGGGEGDGGLEDSLADTDSKLQLKHRELLAFSFRPQCGLLHLSKL